MKYTNQELYNACENMQRYGGSFVEHLGRALHYADHINQARLIAAFPDIIDKYKSMHINLT